VFDHDLFECYDRILCGAECPENGIDHLKSLLKVGGILVVPYKGCLCQFTKINIKDYEVKQIIPCHYKAMVFHQPKPRKIEIEYNF